MRMYRAVLSIDKTGVQTNEYQYLVSAMIQSGWTYAETSLLTRESTSINDIWHGLQLVMRQSQVMDPLSHISLDVSSSEDFAKGIPYPYSDKHPNALQNVESKPLP
jgi:hypothetical protein